MFDYLSIAICLLTILLGIISIIVVWLGYEQFRLRLILVYLVALVLQMTKPLSYLPGLLLLDNSWEFVVVPIHLAGTILSIGTFIVLIIAVGMGEEDSTPARLNVYTFIYGMIVFGYLTSFSMKLGSGSSMGLAYNEWQSDVVSVTVLLYSLLGIIVLFEMAIYLIKTFNRTNHRSKYLFAIGWFSFFVSIITLGLSRFLEGTVHIPRLLYLVPLSFGLLLFAITVLIRPTILILNTPNVHNLYLFSAAGLPYFSIEFKSTDGGLDCVLVTGAVTGLKSIMHEILQSDTQLKSINQEDKRLLIENGKWTTAVLITDKETSVLRESLSNTIRLFEIDYMKELPDWIGDTSIFEEFRITIRKLFNFQEQRFFEQT